MRTSLLLVMLLTLNGQASDPPFDEWLRQVQRYGDTEERRQSKAEAREQFLEHGGASLRYLMDHIHIENLWIRILAQELVVQLEAEEALPVLAAALDSPNESTHRYALYFMGFYTNVWALAMPGLPERVMTYVDDEKAGGSAIRTLGKWQYTPAVPALIQALEHPKERRRIVAVNALRDIGDPAAVDALIAALDDPVATVRYAAERALAGLGDAAEDAVLETMAHASDRALRHMIRILARRPSDAVMPRLVALLEHEDWGVRGDAARALPLFRPDAEWIERIRGDAHPFVRSALYHREESLVD